MPTLPADHPNNPWKRDIHIPEGGPPQTERPDPAIYAAMGQENLFRLCKDFYQALAASSIRALFPTDPEELNAASRKQAMFISGLIGGPPLYAQLIGPPRMRARHLPFQIDDDARQEWLACWHTVLTDPARYNFPAEHLPGFLNFLDGFSAWMVNKAS